MSKRELSDETREEKNKSISDSMKRTHAKRALQKASVFQLKIVDNHLNCQQREALTRIFLEAKWLRNAIIGSDDIVNYKIGKTVPVRLPDGSFEERELSHIGSQMKQSVHKQVLNDMKSLKSARTNGRKTGRLKFVTDVNSIELKQYKTTYSLFPDSQRARIQKVPGRVRVKGIDQLNGYELANARIVKKPSGFYLYVTAYKDKSEIVDDYIKGSVIGIDMGVSTHITRSDGVKINALIEETDRLKRLQRKLSRQVKGSNSYRNTLGKIHREYEKMNNRKNDAANKIVRDLLRHEFVFFQDENLTSWKVRFGKNIHHSILGRVKERLDRHDRAVKINRFVPTTKQCLCGHKVAITLSDRWFSCDNCGRSLDRDTHSAERMVQEGFKLIPVEHRDFKPVETRLDWNMSSLTFQRLSVKPEAYTL